MRERLQCSPRFRSPCGMPERRNQALVGTGILWLSVDRVCRCCYSTVDVAEQKARERQVG